jgi:hypothetical protein
MFAEMNAAPVATDNRDSVNRSSEIDRPIFRVGDESVINKIPFCRFRKIKGCFFIKIAGDVRGANADLL